LLKSREGEDPPVLPRRRKGERKKEGWSNDLLTSCAGGEKKKKYGDVKNGNVGWAVF